MSTSNGQDFDRGAAAYAAYLESDEGRRRAQTTWGFVSMYLPKAGRALDVGGGGGMLAKSLSQAGLRVVVLDRSAAMLAQAVRVNDGAETPPHFLRGAIEGLPFGTSVFDVVTCHAVLEYVPKQMFGLGHLANTVAPGGLLSLETFRAGVSGDGEPDEVFGIARRGIRCGDVHEVLAGHGLSVFASRHDARRLHVLARARR